MSPRPSFQCECYALQCQQFLRKKYYCFGWVHACHLYICTGIPTYLYILPSNDVNGSVKRIQHKTAAMRRQTYIPYICLATIEFCYEITVRAWNSSGNSCILSTSMPNNFYINVKMLHIAHSLQKMRYQWHDYGTNMWQYQIPWCWIHTSILFQNTTDSGTNILMF